MEPTGSAAPKSPSGLVEGLSALSLSPAPAFSFTSPSVPQAGVPFTFSPPTVGAAPLLAPPSPSFALAPGTPAASNVPIVWTFPSAESPAKSEAPQSIKPITPASLAPAAAALQDVRSTASVPVGLLGEKRGAPTPVQMTEVLTVQPSIFSEQPPWPTEKSRLVPMASAPAPLESYKYLLCQGALSLKITTYDANLIELIRQSSTLTKLEIAIVPFPEKQLCLLADNTSITSLNVSSCFIKDEGTYFRSFVASNAGSIGALRLARMSSLRALSIALNHLSDSTLHQLLALPTLESLNAESCTNIRGELAATRPQPSTSIRRLSLARTTLGETFPFICPPNLVSLNLENASIQTDGLISALRSLSQLTMLNINVITHPPELFKAVSEHPNISVLRMDAFVSTPLPVSACQYLSTSTSISYLTLNNYIISAVNAEQLARSESIAHLEVKHGVGPNIAPIILRIPFLRLLNISGYGGASLPEIATNSTVRTLIIDRGNLQDMTPFLYNTRLRRLSFVNNANHNIDYTPFAALTNLRSLNITGTHLHLKPQPWLANTTLLRLQHPQFDFTENWNCMGEHDRVRAEVVARYRAAMLSLTLCCLALGLERSLPWEQRSPFGRLPFEVTLHIMTLYKALWAKDLDQLRAFAQFVILNADAIYDIVRKRQPVTFLEMPRGRGRIAFELHAQKDVGDRSHLSV